MTYTKQQIIEELSKSDTNIPFMSPFKILSMSTTDVSDRVANLIIAATEDMEPYDKADFTADVIMAVEKIQASCLWKSMLNLYWTSHMERDAIEWQGNSKLSDALSMKLHRTKGEVESDKKLKAILNPRSENQKIADKVQAIHMLKEVFGTNAKADNTNN